jgi:hypothetical protein
MKRPSKRREEETGQEHRAMVVRCSAPRSKHTKRRPSWPLQARYGKASPEVQAFGFTQSRKPKPSAQSKAVAVTKAKATREARGTKGAQQKRIKGTSPAPAAKVSTTSTPAVSGTGGAGGTHT